jgi:predicted secreted acid phosphatase
LESKSIEVMIHKMPPIQFVSNVNLIQMKLMKVIYNLKNTMIQEFQYQNKL